MVYSQAFSQILKMVTPIEIKIFGVGVGFL